MINQDRQYHIFAVAILMKEKAKILHLNEQEMFTLGILHDIGYEFDQTETHNITGGNILKKQNYKYYKEVKYHGDPLTEYTSKELCLLNYCDMHINGKGKYVSFEERLEDIKLRRGENSLFYINAKKIIDKLIQSHFLE